MRYLKYQARFEFFVVTVLGVAFAWIALTVAWAAAYQGFWIDEFYTLHAINLPFSEMVKERAQRGHPPLFFMLEKGFVSLPFLRILTPEMQLRLLPYCCWLGAILAFTTLGKKFFPLPLCSRRVWYLLSARLPFLTRQTPECTRSRFS
jgi:hypothetical protein